MSQKVCIDPLVYPLWAFLLLAVPLKFLIGWLGAVICHEMGHITAQYILGGRPGMLCIGPTGAVIEGEDLGFCKNILCVMAGPVIGAFPVLFMRSFPEFAVCAFLLTVYNLIPLYPLDGGRVFYLLGQKWRGMQALSEGIAGTVTVYLAWCAFRYGSPIALLPLVPHLREKYLAKRSNSGYNRVTIEMR